MTKNIEQVRNARMYGLDMFRIALALLVFMFHAEIHIGCDFGLLNPFVSLGAIAMTGFYLLSGFVLYSSSKINPNSIIELVRFYKKRAIAIYPSYIFIGLLAVGWGIIGNPSGDNIIKQIVHLPILLMGISTVFTSLFKFPPNDGLWFVSCLFFCYALYPWLYLLSSRMNSFWCCIVCGCSVFILLWSPLVVKVFDLASIYSNPFFRILEFLIGVILARLSEIISLNLSKKCWLILVLLAIGILIVGVSLLNVTGIVTANYMLCSWVALPCFGVLIILLARDIKISKGVLYLSNLSYSFFLGQFFCFRMFRIINRTWPSITDGNLAKIVISFIICLIFACIVYHLIQTPAKVYLLHRIANSNFQDHD